MSRNQQLHVLVNNAGEFVPEDQVTEDGFEVRWLSASLRLSVTFPARKCINLHDSSNMHCQPLPSSCTPPTTSNISRTNVDELITPAFVISADHQRHQPLRALVFDAAAGNQPEGRQAIAHRVGHLAIRDVDA